MSNFPTIARGLLIINEVRKLIIPDEMLWKEFSSRKAAIPTPVLFRSMGI